MIHVLYCTLCILKRDGICDKVTISLLFSWTKCMGFSVLIWWNEWSLMWTEEAKRAKLHFHHACAAFVFWRIKSNKSKPIILAPKWDSVWNLHSPFSLFPDTFTFWHFFSHHPYFLESLNHYLLPFKVHLSVKHSVLFDISRHFSFISSLYKPKHFQKSFDQCLSRDRKRSMPTVTNVSLISGVRSLVSLVQK